MCIRDRYQRRVHGIQTQFLLDYIIQILKKEKKQNKIMKINTIILIFVGMFLLFAPYQQKSFRGSASEKQPKFVINLVQNQFSQCVVASDCAGYAQKLNCSPGKAPTCVWMFVASQCMCN
eukprot:TRINITY_DN789_c0_g1_i3.p1 TRINITY_DN789_c0_g1~~TRINITY_DN789_c0_g1_i3.p1  ORF type:complete len:120 (+),score=26.29 TRINITY_DN789_c0_g1_i3:64-423(+)